MFRYAKLTKNAVAVAMMVMAFGITAIYAQGINQANPEKALVAARDEKCINECKQRHRDKIEICDDLVNSSGSVYYRDTKWHKQCLNNARVEFDNCMSTCQ
jgi:hypothetical protein